LQAEPYVPASRAALTKVGSAYRAVFRVLSGQRLPGEDLAKRWDVDNVIEVAEDLPRQAAILDCGAFNSRPLLALHRSGFKRLHGIDLNPAVSVLPVARHIAYTRQNIESTAYDDGVFDLVICASTVEHGVDIPRFLAEARRLTRLGGRLYISTDVVPETTDTTSIEAFGFPWHPLKPSMLETFAAVVSAAGFKVGPAPDPDAVTIFPLEFRGRRLTFAAFLALGE